MHIDTHTHVYQNMRFHNLRNLTINTYFVNQNDIFKQLKNKIIYYLFHQITQYLVNCLEVN